ncbi:ABC transporter substrate-binding protein [Bradyrhizobium uaiense]|uniref:ABC transporter substrate-binding protein n=1 Tax=Bradyrhizobium uaiense TaxID=2594946 RepID=A0A6P1BL74_9BRAD|nr:ABC transporter substrate-binding protein [Bradyrhizobium uaiense]NEU98331.1 ABC transporter substrate-binding protein [Bradyrhizobium uaiense]
MYLSCLPLAKRRQLGTKVVSHRRAGAMGNDTGTRRISLSRRAALGGAGALGLAGSLGIIAKPAIVRSADLQKVRLGWAQPAACYAPLGYAAQKGIFAKHGIDVELVDFLAGGENALIPYIASGKVDVAAGFLLGWLKPLDEGLDVKLISGTHAGCTRLLVGHGSGIGQLADLKGKTIAVSQLNGASQQIFAVGLIKLGIDPETEITWRVFPGNLLSAAVQKGEADALAHYDPQTFGWIKDDHLTEIANNQTGPYANISCCTIGANSAFLQKDRGVVRSVVEAILEAHEYVADHPAEVAKFYEDTYKPPVPEERLAELLGQLAYHHHPAGEALEREIVEQIEDLKLIKVFKQNVDARAWAKKRTYNVFA